MLLDRQLVETNRTKVRAYIDKSLRLKTDEIVFRSILGFRLSICVAFRPQEAFGVNGPRLCHKVLQLAPCQFKERNSIVTPLSGYSLRIKACFENPAFPGKEHTE